MKFFVKVNCSLLALLMIIGMLSIPVFASDEVSVASSCQEIRDNNPAADGDYTILSDSHLITVYCANMSTAPAEYLTLVQTGGSYNYSKAAAGSGYVGTDVITHYEKVRFDPTLVRIIHTDRTFSSSTGNINGTLTSLNYGSASTCTWNPQLGTANLDLTGTDVTFAPDQFITGGWEAGGTNTYSNGNQVVNLTGGGYCGGTEPINPYIQLEWQDKVAPVITVGTYTTDPTNQDVVVTVTTNEGTLNAASHTFAENGEFTFTATDAAGNVTNETVTITNIDKVAPVITVAPYTTTPTNQNVTVTATTNEGTLNAPSHTFTENGSYTFTAVDAAGNTSSESITIGNIDKVAPVTSDNAPTDWVNQDVTVNFSSSDLGLGVAATNYIVNGGVQQNGNSVTLTAEGTYSLIYWSVDTAGNIENQQLATVKIDKSGPEIVMLGNSSAYTVDQSINITCSVEDTLSGVASTNCNDIVGAAHSFILGNNSYTFTATDYVGNESSHTISFTVSVNSESLGSLIEQIVTDEEVVVSLKDKLAAIQASITKGNEKSKSGQVGAFINQIKAKTGKSITSEQAELLIQLVREL